jgi:carbon storage regulator
MLVLTRKPGERIVVGSAFQVEVVSVEHGVVKFALYVDQPVTLMPGDVRIEVGGDGSQPVRVTRKVDDSVVIGDDLALQVEILVVSVKGEAVRIGVKAPRDVQVFREEVWEEIRRQNIAAAQAAELDSAQLKKLLGKKPGGKPVASSAASKPASVEFAVRGLDSSAGSKSIESELLKIAGVSAVNADGKTGRAKVQFDPAKVTSEQLLAALEKLGYQVKYIDMS